MRITIKETPEQVALLKQMASSKRDEAVAAIEAFAALVGPVIQEVIQKAPTISALYRDWTFSKNEPKTIPLDLFYDIREANYVRVWSQSRPGGLPTNQIHGLDEMPVSTHNLSSALSFYKHYAENARIQGIAKAMERAAQEFLIKMDIDSATLALGTLAGSTYLDANGAATPQLIRTANQDVLVPPDYNALGTLMARVNSAWNGGTPLGGTHTVTDLGISPEVLEKIKNLSFNPVNSVGSSSLAGTDAFRESIYNSAGLQNFLGTNLICLSELGVGRTFNTLFDNLIAATTFAGFGGATASGFDGTSEELIIGLDRTRDALIRPVTIEDGSTIMTTPDDQWTARMKKIGYTLEVEEGRVVTDARALVGLVV